MLILLTLSFLPSGGRNNTSDLISSGMNLGGNVKKSFQILLNDTEIMETPKMYLNNEKKLSNIPDKRSMKQIVQLLNQRFSTPSNVREKKATENIPQGDDTFYNTPPVLSSSPKVSKKYKKRFNLVSVRSNISKTTASPISSAMNILDGKNAYYNTPPQARLLRHPKMLQKNQKIILKLNRPPEDLKKVPAAEEITTNSLYYNTPAVLREVENIAILKDQYGIEKNITQRKKTRYILRSHRNTRKNTTTRKRHGAHRVRKTNKKSHLKVTETTLTSADVSQSIGTTVNMSSQNESSRNSELRKTFHKPLHIESTFAAVNLLKGDDTLLDMDQAVPAASNDEELSETGFSVSPSLMIRSSSLAPGDILNGFVLIQPSTKEPYLEAYYKKMEANNVRYLSIAFEDLCDHLASKKLEHVTGIVQHIDVTVQELQRKGRLRWLGEPMTTILRDLAILLTGDSADALQVRAMILKSLMQQRRKIVGTDVNEVLDYADSLITKEDGEHLLAVMQEVKRYPDGNKSGKELCKEIIEAFETPFFHLSGTKDLEYLVKKANKAFADRFQQYGNFKEDEYGSTKIASNINAAANTNKTLILRSANDDLKTDLRTAGNPEDIFEQDELPTSEPPDFMNHYNGLSLATKKSTTFSTPDIDFYTTKMVEEGTNTNFFLTLHEVPETTRRKHPEPPKMQDQLPLDPGVFWAKLATHGHWDHLNAYLNLSYWLNPKRTSTYATPFPTRTFSTSGPKYQYNTYYSYKLPIKTDPALPGPPKGLYDDDGRRRDDSQTRRMV